MNKYQPDYYVARHNAFLERYLSQQPCPSERLKAAMTYAMFPGGKRFRGLLVYLTGELLGVRLETLDIIAAAIELTHAYSLVHDDLPAMDNDDIRRGKPSCHRAYDEGTAILVGDALQILAIQLLLQELPTLLKAERAVQIAQILSVASGPAGMIAGHCLDLYELNAPSQQAKLLTENHLHQIHDLKTGQLILACVNMVIAAAPTCDDKSANALRAYARLLGLTFQIQDDYLDRYAPEALKKGRSSDISNDKMTFANYYSQQALTELIDHYFQLTLESLEPFGERAVGLKKLIGNLKHKSA